MSTRGVSQLHFSRGSEILQVQVLTDVNCGPTPHLTEAEAPVPSIFFALPPVRPPRLLWDDRQGSLSQNGWLHVFVKSYIEQSLVS